MVLKLYFYVVVFVTLKIYIFIYYYSIVFVSENLPLKPPRPGAFVQKKRKQIKKVFARSKCSTGLYVSHAK